MVHSLLSRTIGKEAKSEVNSGDPHVDDDVDDVPCNMDDLLSKFVAAQAILASTATLQDTVHSKRLFCT